MAGLLIHAAHAQTLLQTLAADFTDAVQQRLKTEKYFSVALSGGHTPRGFYELLTLAPYRTQIAWDRLLFFWSDERTVPPDHADSNFRMANEALLKQVPVPSEHIFRLKGEESPAQAAAEYESQLRAHLGANAIPIVDAVLLGLGPDGHTASLFPGTSAVQETQKLIVANEVPKLQTTRLTFTFPLINAARHVWFLVMGQDKREMFLRARQKADPAVPASLVNARDTRWYTDITPDKN